MTDNINALRAIKWRNKQREKGRCMCCTEKAELGKVHCKKHLEIHNKRSRNNRLIRKKKVINHYSQGKNCCACCGENIFSFLAIDHKNGGGKKHFEEIGYALLVPWLIKNNFPDGFQILCHNCNIGRSLNNGICPHKI